MPTENVRSGIPPLGDAWGGLDAGGCYLIYGRVTAGIHLPALRLARAASEREEPCIYVSALEPHALAAEAAHLGFDVTQAARAGFFRLLRTPKTLAHDRLSDTARARAFDDLAAIVETYRPALLVLDGFARLARFRAFAPFAEAFTSLHERLAAAGIPVILTMDEPANAAAERIVAHVRAHAMGSVHVAGASDSPWRTLTVYSAAQEAIQSIECNFTRPALPAAHGDGAPHHAGDMPGTVHTRDNEHNAEPRALDRTPPAVPEGIEYLDLSVASQLSTSSRDFLSDSSGEIKLPGRSCYVAGGAAPPSRRAVLPPQAGDPFEHALLDGTTIEAHAPADRPATPAKIDANLFEDVDVAAALLAFDAPSLPETPPVVLPSPMPRMAFAQAFDAALAAHAADKQPFLTVALRMPPDHPAARRFHFIIRAVDEALGPQDRLLADEARCRVVALLPGRTAEAAQVLFAALKTFLRDATSEADYVLQAASAIVVPNGRPFSDATEFLLHAFGET